jgi:hypothetical protein
MARLVRATMKNLISALILLHATLTATYPVLPPKASQTLIFGRGWHYSVPFPVQNSSTIEKLIQCESQGVNISRPDSNHLISWGVLQFNGTSTWNEAEKQFGFYGSPIIPADAIHMADMMISAGEIGRWTCAKILGLNSG